MEEQTIEKVLKDDSLIRASYVKYIAANIWETGLFFGGRSWKVSVTLPSVNFIEVPPNSKLLDPILASINDKSHAILLRVDYSKFGSDTDSATGKKKVKSNFLVSLIGDILFAPVGLTADASKWASLQEVLLREHLVYLHRPCIFRWEQIRALSLRPLNPSQVETFRCKARCTVLDVVRGDIFVVSWASEAQKARKARGLPPYPPVLVLRMTPCEVHHRGPQQLTKLGFEAFLYARKHFIGKDWTVRIHTVSASEREVACNTYASNLDRLGAVEGIATCEDGVNINALLLQKGWATIRSIPFPFYEMYIPLYDEVVKLVLAKQKAPNDTTHKAANMKNLQLLSKLTSSQIKDVIDFLGPEWWNSHSGLSKDSESFSSKLMHHHIFAGNYEKFNENLGTYVFRAMRTLQPMFKIAHSRTPLQGQIQQIVYHNQVLEEAEKGQRHNYLQMDVMVWNCKEKNPDFIWFPNPDPFYASEQLNISVSYTSSDPVYLSVSARLFPIKNQTFEQEIPIQMKGSVEGSYPRYVFPETFKPDDDDEYYVLKCTAVVEKLGYSKESGGSATAKSTVTYILSKVVSLENDDENMNQEVFDYCKSVETRTDQYFEDEKEVECEVEEEKNNSTGYISTIPFFFRTNIDMFQGLEFTRYIREGVSNVICLPTALAQVNGCLGFLGNMYFCSDEEVNEKEFCSLNSCIKEDFSRADVDFYQLAESFFGKECWRNDELMKRIREATQINSLSSAENLLSAAATTSLYGTELIRTVQEGNFFLDSAASDYKVIPMDKSIFSDAVHLLSFSHITRTLVAELHGQTIPCFNYPNADPKDPTYHPDYFLWTDGVKIPHLPCIHEGLLDQLPFSLRNIERKYRASLSRPLVSQENRSAAQPPSISSNAEEVLHASSKAFATLMRLLVHHRFLMFHWRHRADRPVLYGATELIEKVPGFMDASAIAPCCSGLVVLHRVASSGSLLLNVDGHRTTPRTLYLGLPESKKNNFLESVSDTPFMDDQVNLRYIINHAAHALAFECFAESSNDIDLHTSSIRPVPFSGVRDFEKGSTVLLTSTGERQINGITQIGYLRRTRSLPVVYHPLPWLHILGDPLMEREETDVNFEMSHPHEKLPKKVHRFLLAYNAISLCEDPYKAHSISRISKAWLDYRMKLQWRKLLLIEDWCSLLLHRSAPHFPQRISEENVSLLPSENASTTEAIAATGKLYCTGTSQTTALVYYLSKKQLRPVTCMPQELKWIAQTKQEEREQEAKDLESLANPIRKIIQMVDAAVPSGSALFLRARSMQDLLGPPYMEIFVYPADSSPFPSSAPRNKDDRDERGVHAVPDASLEKDEDFFLPEETVLPVETNFPLGIYEERYAILKLNVTYNLLRCEFDVTFDESFNTIYCSKR